MEDQKFIIMTIKKKEFIVKLTNNATFDGSVFKNGRGQVLYGIPSFVRYQGYSGIQEIRVLMHWSEYNVSAIGTLEGHADDSRKMYLYNKEVMEQLNDNHILTIELVDR